MREHVRNGQVRAKGQIRSAHGSEKEPSRQIHFPILCLTTGGRALHETKGQGWRKYTGDHLERGKPYETQAAT